MAAKLLHSLADENPDLQKQMGYMVGAYQIFDDHHKLTSKRLGHGNLQAGNSQLNNGIHEGDSSNAFHRQTATETKINRSGSEKQRISTESLRASFSSSRSSSFSSLEYNKTAQQEVPFPETPHEEMVMDQSSSSPHVGYQCIGLRDVVKESMYREARGLLVQTTTREEVPGSMVKDRDSSRPFQLPKSVDGSYGVGINGKQNVRDELESLRVLAKLREAPWYYNNEARELQRSSHEANGSWNSISRDANAPRFSYDGREVNHLSFKSRDTFKSAPKLKVLPRYSLDSCEKSTRGSDHLTESFQSSGNLDGGVTNPPQSSGPQKRPPNVIAKLMGLESFPSSSSAGDGQLGVSKTCLVEDNNPFLRSLRANDPSRPTGTNSTRSSLKDPASPRWKNPDLIMKPISSSRFPIEPAPWKHVGGSQGSQKQPLKHVKVPVNDPNTFPSVYSEIENKLKDLEFKQSGKDLRALQQIIEAMQAKGLLETQKEEQADTLVNQRDNKPKCTSTGQNPRGQQSPQNTRIKTSSKVDSDAYRTYESPIVIMKPEKLVEKVGIHASEVIPIDEFSSFPKVQSGGSVDNKKGSIDGRATRDRTARNSSSNSAFSSTDKRAISKNIKAIQFSMKSSKESTATSVKNSGQASRRLQPKKLESDRRSRPPNVPPDPSKPRRQYHGHLSESGTSGGKHRPKSPAVLQCGDQLSQISTESWTSSHQGGDIFLQSDISIILQSKLDAEAPSHERSIVITGSQSPSVMASKCSISSIMPKKSTLRIVEDESIEEPAMVAPEHPSPVSVLDTSIYGDDEPSPIKQLSNTSEGNGAEGLNKDHNDEQWNPADKCTANNVGSGLTSEINRKKLQNIEHLVQKLRRLNSEHDEASTDYIASLCGNTNPDHRYISEILLASGLLLKDLGSGLTTFQLHPSGHPINPELFIVLEQTKSSSLLLKETSKTRNISHSKLDHEKFYRKLIFDSVNEILVGKLALFGAFPEPRIILGKLAKKSLTAHQLLKELCFEIEQLQSRKAKCELEENEDGLKSILWEDIKNRSENWTDFNGEISGMVLDVERLVFKDLVNEIVIGEEGSLRAKQSRRRRQLFSK